MSEQPLLGKVVIVTGASRGIGKGIALAFAEAGADLVLSARTVPDLEQTAKEVEALGQRALVVEMDSYKYDTVQAVIHKAKEHFGRLDVLVNNAGGSRNVEDGWKGFLQADHLSVEKLMQMHVVSPYAAAKAAADVMIEQGQGGVIINIDSALAHYPSSTVQNYAAIKRALQEMTKLWAVDLGPYGIRVNAVGPGITRSATTEKLFADKEAEAKAALTVPLRRLGEPSDIANVCVFLSTDKAAWVSGTAIMVSGGQRYG